MFESVIFTGFVASLLAGLATGIGALPVLGTGKPSEQQHNIMLGFAAGVMLAASFFSLIIPGIEEARDAGSSKFAASAIMVAAVLLGAVSLANLNRFVPPLDRLGLGPRAIADARFRRVWLFVAAITLHNFPEGMAVGVSFGGGNYQAGVTTAVGIAIQNLPEGLAVAGSLATLGYSRGKSFALALASGLVEPVAGLAGAALISIALPLLPWALGFAAGAMIYVVASEVIPDTHAHVTSKGKASAGLMVGLVAMMFLDTSLG